MTYDLVLRSRRVITPDGQRPAAICITGERIAAVEPYDAVSGVDLGDLVLLPGLVDTHVHVNEPGRTDWEGFATATAAGAAGGVTTIVDMPLNSVPPTLDVAALEAKRTAAYGQCTVDVGFWGGAVPGNLDQLPDLHAAGVLGFKCFLADSGVPEFGHLDAAGLDAALATVNAVFLVHAEDPDALGEAKPSRRYADFLASRPRAAEDRAVAVVIDAARRARARVHVLHLSSMDALPLLRAARTDGVRVSAETCPHYLSLVAEDVADGATEFKCCPPIRDALNREALWNGLRSGAIDCVVSDHSPCPPDLKQPGAGDFASAWGGIASLQLSLPVVWTHARRRGLSLSDVVRWMAAHPADLAGLLRKGRIEVGYDADLVAFAPDEQFTVDPARLHHRHPLTPYAGTVLRGVVRTTWLRGQPVDGTPRGQLLVRGES
ncbi:MAG TPA: allantoinase AllB [Micromonosporaceae bacterium]|jgi:allantoinase|nr:allantoinase AllB [Micromonosporaceae bacterium]